MYQRLDSVLRSRGAATKRQIHAAVAEGRITVNGQTAEDPAMECPEAAVICMDGVEIPPRAPVVLMMNKPVGTICVLGNPRHPSVFSLLPGEPPYDTLFSVGRLDVDSEGLLLLTNDGSLCQRITSPDSHLSKLYKVWFERPLQEDAAERIRAGIRLQTGPVYRPAELTVLGPGEATVRITEGKYHEVRRIMKAVGTHVCRLQRLSIGGLELDPGLAPGEFRPLTEEELASIFA